MAELKISEHQERILSYFQEQHSAGSFEVSLSSAAAVLGCSVELLRSEKRVLIGLGLMDEGESLDTAALTPLGLRVTRSLRNTSLEDSSAGEDRNLGGKEQLTRMFSGALGRWPAVVTASNLTESEKERLLKLGQELFSHPATVELLRRALVDSD